jgi:hypothetical protein
MILLPASRTGLRPLRRLPGLRSGRLLKHRERGLREVSFFLPLRLGFGAALGFGHESACHESRPGNIQK